MICTSWAGRFPARTSKASGSPRKMGFRLVMPYSSSGMERPELGGLIRSIFMELVWNKRKNNVLRYDVVYNYGKVRDYVLSDKAKQSINDKG
jgi:hypothetical protein